MNKDIIVEKIEYLSRMPHSALVEHCIYLENENDMYKTQKYITDFISENGIICEKNKEIERLNNIIQTVGDCILKDISILKSRNVSTEEIIQRLEAMLIILDRESE